MIFNQDEHEIQVGTVDIEDGNDQIVLSIEGSKKFEPSLVLTPQGMNANLNTFVVDRAKWGSIVVPLDGGVNQYDLARPWAAKATNDVYNANDNAKLWWRCNDLAYPVTQIAATLGGINSNPCSLSPSGFTPAEFGDHYIQDSTLNFPGGTVVNFETAAGKLNALIAGEATGNAMSLSFWVRPLSEPISGGMKRDVIVKFGSGWGYSDGSYRAFSFAKMGISLSLWVEWAETGGPGTVVDSFVATPVPMSWSIGDWLHVVYTRNDIAWTGDGTNHWKIYVNGEPGLLTGAQVKPPVDLEIPGTGKDVMYFGNAHAYESLDGDLADVAVWNTQLSAENVKALYNAASQGVREGIEMTGQKWFSLIKRSTDIGDVTVQYQAIGASPLRVK